VAFRRSDLEMPTNVSIIVETKPRIMRKKKPLDHIVEFVQSQRRVNALFQHLEENRIAELQHKRDIKKQMGYVKSIFESANKIRKAQ
jgi:hypothetical protein